MLPACLSKAHLVPPIGVAFAGLPTRCRIIQPPVEHELDSTTLSAKEDQARLSAPEGKPHLFLVLDSHRPLSAPLRIALEGLDEVIVGRGPTRTIERTCDAGVCCLWVRLDDEWLSRRHARFSDGSVQFAASSSSCSNIGR